MIIASGNRYQVLWPSTRRVSRRVSARRLVRLARFACLVRFASLGCFARLRRLYYGAADGKGGGVENGPRIFSQATCHHRPEVYGGMDEGRAATLLREFFKARR